MPWGKGCPFYIKIKGITNFMTSVTVMGTESINQSQADFGFSIMFTSLLLYLFFREKIWLVSDVAVETLEVLYYTFGKEVEICRTM